MSEWKSTACRWPRPLNLAFCMRLFSPSELTSPKRTAVSIYLFQAQQKVNALTRRILSGYLSSYLVNTEDGHAQGTAKYYSVSIPPDNHLQKDVVWWYQTPLAAVAEIRGYVAFYDEFVDVWVDGVKQERPKPRDLMVRT